MLQNRQIADMRRTIEDLLPDLCNLLTSTYTSDGAGGGTVTWGTAVRNLACRVDEDRTEERITDPALRAHHRMMFTIPYDTTITEAYRIEHNGYTYNVTGVNTGTSWDLCRRARAERVE